MHQEIWTDVLNQQNLLINLELLMIKLFQLSLNFKQIYLILLIYNNY